MDAYQRWDISLKGIALFGAGVFFAYQVLAGSYEVATSLSLAAAPTKCEGKVCALVTTRTASARTHRAARFNQPLHARQVSGQLAAVASARTIRASRLSADDRLGLFLRGIQHALGDFDVFNRQIVLVRVAI